SSSTVPCMTASSIWPANAGTATNNATATSAETLRRVNHDFGIRTMFVLDPPRGGQPPAGKSDVVSGGRHQPVHGDLFVKPQPYSRSKKEVRASEASGTAESAERAEQFFLREESALNRGSPKSAFQNYRSAALQGCPRGGWQA